MNCLCNLYQHADWKNEKHVPVIDAPEEIDAGENCRVSVCIGKEIPHPNKTEHHIRWIELYFKPEGAKFPIQIGRAEFCAHGESTEGADKSGVYAHHCATFSFRTDRSGVIIAGSYCNIHGLWESTAELVVK